MFVSSNSPFLFQGYRLDRTLILDTKDRKRGPDLYKWDLVSGHVLFRESGINSPLYVYGPKSGVIPLS